MCIRDSIFTFTTATPPPAIVETSPVDGAVNVPVNVLSSSGNGITVTFSKPMDQSLVKRSKLTLTDLTATYQENAVGARYVRVELPTGEWLHMAEVQVFENGVNVALGGTATQSTTAWGGGARTSHRRKY